MLKLNNATFPVAPKDARARVLAGPVPQVMDKIGSTLQKQARTLLKCNVYSSLGRSDKVFMWDLIKAAVRLQRDTIKRHQF